MTTLPSASLATANAAATGSTQSNPHNDVSASVSSQNSRLPASKTILSSATVVPASAKPAVPGTDNGNGRSSASSSIPASTSLASTKGKRELRNRFILKH